MPWGLKRYQQSGQSHFVTFSCYRRHAVLADPQRKVVFEKALERVRCDYDLRVYGYVVMPDNVHLLVSEPGTALLAVAIKSSHQTYNVNAKCQ
jgi:putative transposase